MCGIACIISNKQSDLLKISDMTDTIIHRGVDGCGHYIDSSGISLGHRRLKIIDLSDDANQPMHYQGRFHIVFNGEIYNYIEIREVLKGIGYMFGTQSDTEVLLKAYIEWGKYCLNKFNGMFSFVIYDSCTGEVFAARDRFGVKPLYWWMSDGGLLALASEIKEFTVLPGWSAIGNVEILRDFLGSGFVDHTDHTMFKGVYQLRGGYAVKFNIKDVSKFKDNIYKWYELPEEKYVFNYNTAVNQFKDLLIDAVNIRLRSDVPVGSCLSGGLDSSSIVCIASDTVNRDSQNTFTLVSEDPKYDETKYAQFVVDKTGVKRHFISVTPSELFSKLDELVWQQDEPFQSTSMYGQWKVFQEARKENVPVILDGQGADELLLGYHYVFPIRLKILLNEGRYLQLFREIVLLRKIPGFKYMNIVRQVYGFWKNRKNTTTSSYKSIPLDFSSLKRYSHTLLYYSSLPALLHWEDRDSMSHTVESRLPFLDYRVVEFLYSLPDDYKLYNSVTKIILRDSMEGILPEEVRWRMDKIGFATAESTWFTNNIEEFRKRFYEAVELSNGLLGQQDIDKFEKVARCDMEYDFSIWRAIAFGAWVKRFDVIIK